MESRSRQGTDYWAIGSLSLQGTQEDAVKGAAGPANQRGSGSEGSSLAEGGDWPRCLADEG